eukprot:gene8447-9349_t
MGIYKVKINIPALLVIGSPVSCKSKAVELLMATLGMLDADDPTYAGLLRCVAENALPKHWEDVSDLETFERIAKNTYNQVALSVITMCLTHMI